MLRYHVGQSVTVYIINITTKHIQQHIDTSDDESPAEQTTGTTHTKYVIDLSMKHSRITGGTAVKPMNSVNDLSQGQLVQGYIKQTNKSGCFIHIAHDITVRCELKNLNDRFITDVENRYYSGKLVTGM